MNNTTGIKEKVIVTFSVAVKLTENIIAMQENALFEYLNAKGIILENSLKDFELKKYHDRMEFWHNGDRILGCYTILPKLDFSNDAYSYKYTCKIIRYWKGESE